MVQVESKSRPTKRSQYAPVVRRDLQGMRALAVLAVFSDHLFGWPGGGFVGVDIFFVLSGFFITALLLRERSQTGELSFRNFYVRRVKRILPSALLVLVATVLAANYLFPTFRAKQTLIDALYASVFAANWRFESLGADYFQQTQPPSPIQHYWSLSIEEQFYFVWPVVLVLVFASTRKYHGRKKEHRRQHRLTGWMLLIVVASFAWAWYMSGNNPNEAYFSTFTRVWELGVGALLAIAQPWLANIPDRARPAIAYAGLVGVLLSLFLIDSTVQFPAPWAALPVLSTAVVVASFGGGAEVRGMPVLTNPVARYFGDTSYTLYLWHWPVIILLSAVLSVGLMFYLIALTVALALTAVTYRYYEDPIRKSQWLNEIRRPDSGREIVGPRVWAFVGMVTAVAVVMSILKVGFDEKLARAQEEVSAASAVTDIPTTSSDPCFGAPAMVNQECELRTPDAALAPGVNRFANDLKGQMACYRTRGARLRACTSGYEGPDAIRIALVGDSHAASMLPALWPLLKENKWQLTTYVGTECVWRVPGFGDCPIDEIEDQLIAKKYDLVVTASHRNVRSTPKQIHAAWDPVAAEGTRIAVLVDNPFFGEDGLACLSRVSLGGDHTGDCGIPRDQALRETDPLLEAADRFPGVTAIDLTKFYCLQERCPTVIGNVIVNRDPHHLTATYAATLAPELAKGIQAALGR